MQPIHFECTKLIPEAATAIAANIADLSRWSEFSGYGVLPGIANAEYVVRTNDMLGSCVRVHNTDGSQHLEEFCVWDLGLRPGPQIVIKLHEFSPPLNRLATHFIEAWQFETHNSATLVRRSFQLFPKQPLTRPCLWLIALLFKRAIARHLAEMAAEAEGVKGLYGNRI
ncbi:MAG: hypothetical protein R3C14_49455 [Caldilineaceae bacterium]